MPNVPSVENSLGVRTEKRRARRLRAATTKFIEAHEHMFLLNIRSFVSSINYQRGFVRRLEEYLEVVQRSSQLAPFEGLKVRRAIPLKLEV